MTDYSTKVKGELRAWKEKMLKQSSLINRLSKKAQTKVNSLIPEKVHTVMTESIKKHG